MTDWLRVIECFRLFCVRQYTSGADVEQLAADDMMKEEEQREREMYVQTEREGTKQQQIYQMERREEELSRLKNIRKKEKNGKRKMIMKYK